MYKLGIVTYDGLDHPPTWLGKKKRASALLLQEMTQRSPVDPKKYDNIIKCIATPNGTWKDTKRGRFTVLDSIILEDLKNIHNTTKSLIVMDLAVSSGVTSVEFYKLLRSAFSVDFIATDLWYEAISIKSPQYGWIVVLYSDGNELQYVVGPFVLPGQGRESLFYPINIALRQLCRWMTLPKAQAILKKYNSSEFSYFQTSMVDGYEVTKLCLLAHECMELAKSSRYFRFEVSNIMEPFAYRADVIRAMNILTPTYFYDTQLQQGIRNCLNVLNREGVLVLGQSITDESDDIKATIFRRKDRGLDIIRQVNSGCGIEHLVDDVVRDIDRLA